MYVWYELKESYLPLSKSFPEELSLAKSWCIRFTKKSLRAINSFFCSSMLLITWPKVLTRLTSSINSGSFFFLFALACCRLRQWHSSSDWLRTSFCSRWTSENATSSWVRSSSTRVYLRSVTIWLQNKGFIRMKKSQRQRKLVVFSVTLPLSVLHTR